MAMTPPISIIMNNPGDVKFVPAKCCMSQNEASLLLNQNEKRATVLLEGRGKEKHVRWRPDAASSAGGDISNECRKARYNEIHRIRNIVAAGKRQRLLFASSRRCRP